MRILSSFLILCFLVTAAIIDTVALSTPKTIIEKLTQDAERVLRENGINLTSASVKYSGPEAPHDSSGINEWQVQFGINKRSTMTNEELVDLFTDKILSSFYKSSPDIIVTIGPTTYDSKETIDELQRLHADGDVLATMRLAERFKRGLSVDQDVRKACLLFGEAFLGDLPDLYQDVLECMLNGHYTVLQANTPEDLIRLAAEKYGYNADSFLAEHLYNGFYLPEDKIRAKLLFESAGDDGIALNYLGIIYQNGEIVTKDLRKARQYFIDASALEEALAMYNLAISYQLHETLSIEPDLMRYWMKQAALKEYSPAVMAYAKILLDKDGAYDPFSALVFFKKASSIGVKEADCYVQEIGRQLYDNELNLNNCH